MHLEGLKYPSHVCSTADVEMVRRISKHTLLDHKFDIDNTAAPAFQCYSVRNVADSHQMNELALTIFAPKCQIPTETLC